MMNQNRVSNEVKLDVLEMLRSIVVKGTEKSHGDIKDGWQDYFVVIGKWLQPKKPENILVDYDYNNGLVTDFKCYLGDWGTAFVMYSEIFGGTPVYAGPRAYENDNKDFFSFGRLALELFTSEQGICHDIIN